MIVNPNYWRVSKSGFSIVTGWSTDRKIICSYPGKIQPLDGDAFSTWLSNAELICELFNKNIDSSSKA